MILMEYAEGETLRERIDKAGSKGLDRIVIYQLFEQLMQALKYIHSQGLIHRDIKPENIFVNPNSGRLQVGDFGLAKRVKSIGDAPEIDASYNNLPLLIDDGNPLNRSHRTLSTSAASKQNPFKKNKNAFLGDKERGASFNKHDDSSDGHVGGTLMYLSPEMRPQAR